VRVLVEVVAFLEAGVFFDEVGFDVVFLDEAGFDAVLFDAVIFDVVLFGAEL
jgi:hypothetical protein